MAAPPDDNAIWLTAMPLDGSRPLHQNGTLAYGIIDLHPVSRLSLRTTILARIDSASPPALV